MDAPRASPDPKATLRERLTLRWHRAFHQRLTPRGRWLFWACIAFAVIGLDTRVTQVYVLFAGAVGIFASAYGLGILPPPRVRATLRLPERATAGAAVHVRALVEPEPGAGAISDVQVSWHVPPAYADALRFDPEATWHALAPGRVVEAAAVLRASRRGRYVLRLPDVRRTDALRLACTRAAPLGERTLLVYPRFFLLDSLEVPLGRRYQPGGIPMSSSTGDSLEFVGTREYRPGDALKSIHWRSFARRAAPVVKEFQEEYFARIALILDTFLPPRAGAPEARGFEAAISVLASIADHFSRSELVVDILAAGPDVYEVSAGRSLAYLDNILDVLACLEPCRDAPFSTIGPALFDKLERLTAVVAVLVDWDEPRAAFLRRVQSLGTAVRVIVVREGPTTLPLEGASVAELASVERMTPAEVEERIRRTEAAPSPRAPGVPAGARP